MRPKERLDDSDDSCGFAVTEPTRGDCSTNLVEPQGCGLGSVERREVAGV